MISISISHFKMHSADWAAWAEVNRARWVFLGKKTNSHTCLHHNPRHLKCIRLALVSVDPPTRFFLNLSCALRDRYWQFITLSQLYMAPMTLISSCSCVPVSQWCSGERCVCERPESPRCPAMAAGTRKQMSYSVLPHSSGACAVAFSRCICLSFFLSHRLWFTCHLKASPALTTLLSWESS